MLTANAMVSAGRHVDIVAMNAVGEFRSLVSADVRVVDLKASRFSASIKPFARYLRDQSPVAVYSQMFETGIYAAAAVALSGRRTRLSSTIHTTTSERYASASLKRRLVARIATLIHRHWIKQIIAVSDAVKLDFSEFCGVPPDRIAVVHNPVDPRLEQLAMERLNHPWLSETGVSAFVAVGSLKSEKGFDTLLRALAIARNEVEAKLVIVGEGPQRQPLADLAEALGVSGAVDLVGFDANPFRYMSRASAFVLSSRIEGHPTALVEAAALGVPCIATDCRSGPREILGSSRGRLVPVDDARALARAMIDHYIAASQHLS